MKNDLETFVKIYKNLQQLELRLRRATDMTTEHELDKALADKLETARQAIADHLDEKLGAKPVISEITEIRV